MKRKIYGILAVLIVISVLLEGCGVNGAVCKYLKNCYFESKNSATFSDVNVLVDYSLIPVNAYIEKIGEFSDRQLVSNKAIIDLFLLQKNEMGHSNFSQRDLFILQGDLLFTFSGKNFSKNLPPSLKIYLDKLYKNFVLEYKNKKLPDESDIRALSYYENLLYLMRETKIFQQDISLLDAFKDDSNFTKDKILSRGIFIVSAMNYLILRSRIVNSQFYPLPFSADLIQKRKNQLIDMKNILLSNKYKFTDSYKLFALETFAYFSLAFDGICIINTTDKKKIKEYFERKTSTNGLFDSNTGISDSIFNTYLVTKISNRLLINGPWHKKVIQAIEKLNRSSIGVFVVYNEVYFNPWDTYRALFVKKEKCTLYFERLYNINKLKNIITNYLQYPDKHTFEENYYAEKSALLLGLTFNKKNLNQYLSKLSDFSKSTIQEVYFYLLLAKLSDISVSNKEKIISTVVYRDIPFVKGSIHFMVKAYLSLRMVGINDKNLELKIEEEIKQNNPQDIRTLYYEYLFAHYTNNKNIGRTCKRNLKDFKYNGTELYCMTRIRKLPSLAATYYAYKILDSTSP